MIIFPFSNIVNAQITPEVDNDVNLSSTFTMNQANVFRDNDLGFSIHRPNDWTIGQGDSEFNTVVGFHSPKNDANVDIRIFPQGDYKSIKEYGDTFKESDHEYTLLQYYRNSSTTLSDKPAFRVIYLTTYNPSIIEETYGYKSSTSKAMMVATMVPEKESIYAVVFFAQSANFDNYIPIVDKMIDSFLIYGKGPVIQEDDN